MAEADVQEVVLFDGEDASFGDARLNPGRPNSIESTLHGIVAGGGFAPYFKRTATSWGVDVSLYRKAIEWEDSSGTPLILAIGGAIVARALRIDADGTTALDKTFSGKKVAVGAGDICAALHSNGGTTPYIFACFGTSGDMEYRDNSGNWNEVSGTPSQADGLFSENGNLWAITGHQVRKWAAGTDPTAATAGAPIDVGTSAWPITGVALLGQSLVLFTKADGIYIYDIDTQRFENIWAGLAKNPHPDTGKGTITWGNEVFVPLGWGGMVRVTPNLDVLPASPLFGARPDVRTPGRNRVSAMAGEASYLYATLEPFTQRLGSEVGLAVYTTNDFSSFNNRTTAVTDGDPSTDFDLADDLSPYSAAFICVGADFRFLAPWFAISAQSLSGAPTLEYWNGTWQTVTKTDYTGLMTRDGPLLPAARIPADWEKSSQPGVSKYWMRIGLSTAHSLTDVLEVRVLPDIAPLAGANVAESGFDEVGARTHIIRGYSVGSSMVWEDVISLSGDQAQELLFSRLKAHGGGRQLVTIGQEGYALLPIGTSGEPNQERYPDCINGFASLLRLPARDWRGQNTPAPTAIKQIAYLKIFAKHMEKGEDLIQAWVSWDDGPPGKVGESRHGSGEPIAIPPAGSGRGFEYQVIVGLEDSARGARAPQITRVVAGVRVVSGERP